MRACLQVEGLALAAGELAALGINTSLQELRTESGAQAAALVREWLGRLENAKSALSEHRCHPQITCMSPWQVGTLLGHAGNATWHAVGTWCLELRMRYDSRCLQSKAVRMRQ